MLIQI